MTEHARLALYSLLSAAAFGQRTPAFDVADVHAVPYTNRVMQGGVLNAGRYEIQNATMVDLIKTAYGVDADTVFGGPSWLDWNRFDVMANAPAATSAATVKLMLQTLLADRFKLVVHKDTKPMPGFVLAVGKGAPKLKEPDGSGDAGCPSPPPVQEEVPYHRISCRNTTMEAFALTLRALAGEYLSNPVVDSTSLKGGWDFDLKWTFKPLLQMAGSKGITIFDAVEKQLGLELEPQRVPVPVIVVDSVNEKPTGNPPGVTTSLPPLPPPEFEVASVRPSVPGQPFAGTGNKTGGRLELHSVSMRLLIVAAWDLGRFDQLVGAPEWVDTDTYDIIAKAANPGNESQVNSYTDGAMLRTLLADRFKMKTHYEDRPTDAYTLVAVKPKLKKADPSNRTGCKEGPAPTSDRGDGPALWQYTCLNITMAQFAARLQDLVPGLHYPVPDATGIEGAYDISIAASPCAPRCGGPAPVGNTGDASDPSGGVTFFDALEKQLGLKLEKTKRPEPVFVIDHIEEKPTEN